MFHGPQLLVRYDGDCRPVDDPSDKEELKSPASFASTQQQQINN